MKPVHSARLERWLGTERIEALSNTMRGWYGPPITLMDVPGGVQVNGDGDFSGRFERGQFACAMDALADYYTRVKAAYRTTLKGGVLSAGFGSISDALSRASQGYQQAAAGTVQKVGPTGVIGVTSSLWRVGNNPSAGGAGSAAPGGRAPTSATTGAMSFTNPSSGTLHLIGADISASVINNSLLLYDRLFDVAKTMNSASTESVTGTPSRYQSQTSTDPDYIGGNFLFVEVGGTALAATAHNWTTCTYTDQGGSSSTLPSLTGNSGAIVDRLDHPTQQFFAPLEAGDVGIKALTQMQCSASVATGAINFVIGHPLGFMAFPIANFVTPFDWLTNRQLTPRVFDNACLALLEVTKPATTATTYTGQIHLLNAAP